MTFADRLNSLIEEKGISGNRLAKELGIAESVVRSWRHGSPPREKNLEKLAKFFGVHPAWLRYGIGDG